MRVSVTGSANRRRWLGAACAGVSALVLTRAVLARGAVPPASHHVPPECPTRAEWLAALQNRLPPLLRTHPLLETLAVHIEKIDDASGHYYVGELAPTGDSLSRSRRVRGATCEDVTDALSFIGALALERVAAGHDVSLAGTEPQPEAPSAALDEGKPTGTDEPHPSESNASARERVRVGAVGFALLQDGLTPGRTVDFGVALRFAWSSPSWQPLFLLGAYASVPEQVSMARGGEIRFEHWSSHAVGCPWRFPESGVFGARPCLELDVGRSSGEGLGVSGATKRSAPWLSGGAQLRAELVAWERVELGASIAGVVPFWRAHFLFTPDLMSYEAPSFGFRAGSYASVIF